jgi:hypothetical protein
VAETRGFLMSLGALSPAEASEAEAATSSSPSSSIGRFPLVFLAGAAFLAALFVAVAFLDAAVFLVGAAFAIDFGAGLGAGLDVAEALGFVLFDEVLAASDVAAAALAFDTLVDAALVEVGAAAEVSVALVDLGGMMWVCDALYDGRWRWVV